jgi:hypothetical protein
MLINYSYTRHDHELSLPVLLKQGPYKLLQNKCTTKEDVFD